MHERERERRRRVGRGNGIAHKFIHCTLATTVNNPHGDSVRYGQVAAELTHTLTPIHTLVALLLLFLTAWVLCLFVIFA